WWRATPCRSRPSSASRRSSVLAGRPAGLLADRCVVSGGWRRSGGPPRGSSSYRRGGGSRSATGPARRLLVDLQHRQERLLGHLDPPHLLHPLLPRFLLLQQLLLAGDVAAVELRGDV